MGTERQRLGCAQREPIVVEVHESRRDYMLLWNKMKVSVEWRY